MTDLINKLIAAGKIVSSYLIQGSWIDVGQKKDYCRANDVAAKGDYPQKVQNLINPDLDNKVLKQNNRAASAALDQAAV